MIRIDPDKQSKRDYLINQEGQINRSYSRVWKQNLNEFRVKTAWEKLIRIAQIKQNNEADYTAELEEQVHETCIELRRAYVALHFEGKIRINFSNYQEQPGQQHSLLLHIISNLEIQ